MRISPLLRIRQKDFSLRFYPSSVSRVLWVDAHRGQTTYPHDERFFRAYLQPGDVVIDVGANVGFFSLLSAALVGPTGRVYAIEAHPQISRYLRGNVKANKFKNVLMHNCALGEKTGTVCLSDQRKDDRNMVVRDKPGLEVPLKKLDDLKINDQHINLLKIDVEGYEKFVLEGAAKLLSRVQCIYFESCDVFSNEFGYTSPQLFQLISDHGFTIYRWQNEMLFPLLPNHNSAVCENMIAVRDLSSFLQRTNLCIAK